MGLVHLLVAALVTMYVAIVSSLNPSDLLRLFVMNTELSSKVSSLVTPPWWQRADGLDGEIKDVEIMHQGLNGNRFLNAWAWGTFFYF